MATVGLQFDIDYARDLYLAGKPFNEIAEEFGICSQTLRARLTRAGIPRRPRRIAWDHKAALQDAALATRLPDILHRYREGESAFWLAKENGIPYGQFLDFLTRQGELRSSNSKTLLRRYAAMTPEERRAIASPAFTARTGRPARTASLERRALTMQRTLQLSSRWDLLLGLWLAQRGVQFTIQLAVGSYNVDIAVHEPAVAVEVIGPGHGGANAGERTPYLFDRGWRLIEVKVPASPAVKNLTIALTERCADNIVALLELARSNEPSWGQYCVIGGDGEILPVIEN